MPSIFAVLMQCYSLSVCLLKRIAMLFGFLVCLSMFVMSHDLLKIADSEDILC